MLMGTAIFVILIAGAVGGIVNGLMTDNGFLLPRLIKGTRVLRPGIFGNMFIGAVAAFLFWTIYGSGGEISMDGSAIINMRLITVGFAVLTGIGGARWLTDEVDKYILRKSTAMAMNADAPTTQSVMHESPTQVLAMVEEKMK